MQCRDKLLVTYEEFVAQPEAMLARCCEYLGHRASAAGVRDAVAMVRDGGARKNRVVPGRGKSLPADCVEAISRMADHYPHIDFSPLGISADQVNE